jgi:hypothetical protein
MINKETERIYDIILSIIIGIIFVIIFDRLFDKPVTTMIFNK